MKFLNYTTIFVLFLLLVLACKKESLPGENSEGEVVFSVETFVDGGKQRLAAGVDNYYMFTEFEKGPDTIYTFSGTLKEENCVSICGAQLRVEIRDFQKVRQGNEFMLEQALRCGTYNFKDTSVAFQPNTNYRLELTSETNATGNIKYTWTYQDDFDTGMMKNLADPIINFNLSGSDQRDKILGLQLEDEAGNRCYQERKNFIIRSHDCFADFTAERMTNGKIRLEAVGEPGLEPFQYSWSTGDTTKVIEVDGVEGEYTLDILSGLNGCVNKIRKTVKPQTNGVNTISCFFNWAKNEDTSDPWNGFRGLSGFQLFLGKVTLVYSDEQGVEYRSDARDQADDNFFEVLGVTPYEDNEKGQPTSKLTIQYRCDLWSDSGQKKQLEGEGIIALAHP